MGWRDRYGRWLQVIRLDFLGPVGRTAARHYGVWLIPALVLTDGHADLLERQVALMDPHAIAGRLDRILAGGTGGTGVSGMAG